MIKIYRAADVNEANIVRGLLEAHGIMAHVGGQFLQGGIGDLPAMDLMSVMVGDDDEVRASHLIRAYERGEFALRDDEFPTADD